MDGTVLQESSPGLVRRVPRVCRRYVCRTPFRQSGRARCDWAVRGRVVVDGGYRSRAHPTSRFPSSCLALGRDARLGGVIYGKAGGRHDLRKKPAVEGVGWDTVGQFYLGDRLLGSYFTNYTYFMHRNMLGSENGVTNWAGSENGEELFNPLGVPWATVGSPVIWTFAGFEHGHTDIMQWPGTFREYDPNKGRWLTPDPLGGEITNPQSLNRYTYVLNQPTTLIDPSGLAQCPGPQCPNNYMWGYAVYGGYGGTLSQYFSNPSWKDPFSLVGIPVVTDTFTPPQLLSTVDFGAMGNANGYATSVSLIALGGWTTITLGDAFTLLGSSLGPAGADGSFSWWGTFAKSFVRDFSFKSARQPGESFGACVDRAAKSLFGNTGARVFGAVTGASLFTGALTLSPGTQVVKVFNPDYWNVISWKRVPLPSVADLIVRGGVEAGTISAETGAAISATAAAASKVAVPVAAVTSGLLGGLLGACR
jgi:RHS repeat-associated protein